MSSDMTPPVDEHDININTVFEDDRNGELLRLVYKDDDIALLKSEARRRTDNGHIHRPEGRDVFSDQINSGRLKSRPDADPDIPEANIPIQESSETTNDATNSEVVDINDFANGNDSMSTATDGGGDGARKSEQPPSEPEEDVSSKEQPTPEENDKDWKEVKHIGEKGANNLYDAGIRTANDIEAATDDELKVDLIGQKGVERLREYVDDE